MTIREWIRNREINGLTTFTFENVLDNYPLLSEQVVKNELFRLSTQKITASVYRGFYVIIPPQYAAKGIVPPLYYIDSLMSYLHKPYYISLLSAAELLGAAHQRPQRFSVTTVYPKPSVSPAKNNLLAWSYRKEVPTEFLLMKNSETGVIQYSNAELTALDLVQYEQYVGGLSRVATILEELSERIDFKNAAQSLFNYTTLAAIQRLGYILDEVLQQSEIADILHNELTAYSKRLRYVPLSTRHANSTSVRNKRWKISVNLDIEIDEL